MLRPAFPDTPRCGTRNAAGLIQPEAFCSGNISETPGTRSGRCEVLSPLGTSAAARLIVTFTGLPVRAVAIQLRDQPPITRCARLGVDRKRLPEPNGI